jgi:malate dehydrogenase
MFTVAIIGAGDLGGAIAQALAGRDRVDRLLLVDVAGSVAAGKALDVQQMGAVHGSRTRLDGTADASRVSGSAACVVADRYGRTSVEWQGDEGLTMLRGLVPYLAETPVVFAGAFQGELLSSAVRDVKLPHRRAIGSSPEAFRSAVTAIVAVEARCSPREVALTVLGAPGRFVVPWSEASIGGYALERAVSQVQLTRIEARTAKLWPPGPLTLGTAAARVAEALIESSRQSYSVLTMLAGEFGVKDRIGALPAVLSSTGIVHTRLPSLSVRERVLVDTALGEQHGSR